MGKKKIKGAFEYGPHAIDLVWERRILDAAKAFGDNHIEKSRVRIDPSQLKSIRDETIIHELVHIASFAGAVPLEERDVKTLAGFLAQMLKPYLRLPDPKGA